MFRCVTNRSHGTWKLLEFLWPTSWTACTCTAASNNQNVGDSTAFTNPKPPLNSVSKAHKSQNFAVLLPDPTGPGLRYSRSWQSTKKHWKEAPLLCLSNILCSPKFLDENLYFDEKIRAGHNWALCSAGLMNCETSACLKCDPRWAEANRTRISKNYYE